MTKEKRDNALEFYRSIWVSGMTKETKLTNKAIEIILGSAWFAKWMLVNKFGECKKAVKQEIENLK